MGYGGSGVLLPNPLLGQEIRKARAGKGWSQAQLAKAIGSPKMQADISKYENGEARPSYGTVQRISEQTGVPIATFLTSENDGYRAGLMSAANRLKRVLLEIEQELESGADRTPDLPIDPAGGKPSD